MAGKNIAKNSVKVGLALSGGSALGIAHVGVLKALAEHGIPVDVISGTSAGAVVAAGFAFGLPIEKLIEITKSVSWKKLSRISYSKLGIRTNSPMATFITELIGDVDIKSAKIPLAIVATDIETYEMVIFRSGKVDEAVRASTSIPGYFTPVEIKGRLLVDGGISENLPLTALDMMGATIKIGVNLTARPMRYRPKNIFDVVMNSFTTLSHHRNTAHSAQADILIEPDLQKFDYMKFKDVELMMEEGYKATVKMIPEIKEAISARQKSESLFARIKSYFS